MVKRRSLKSDHVGSNPTLPANGSLAQKAERSAHNGEALGSIPGRATGSVAKTEKHSAFNRETREFDSPRTHQELRDRGSVAEHLAFNQNQDGFESLRSHHKKITAWSTTGRVP